MRHYSLLHRGRSVVKLSGTWTTTDEPDSTGLTEGVDLFLGGHVYDITSAMATELTAAGYGAYIV
jgi:hypothetical protein